MSQTRLPGWSLPGRDQPPLDIPSHSRVVGVQLSVEDRKESTESFARRLKNSGRGGPSFWRGRRKSEVLAISGFVEGTEGDRLQFRCYQDQTRARSR